MVRDGRYVFKPDRVQTTVGSWYVSRITSVGVGNGVIHSGGQILGLHARRRRLVQNDRLSDGFPSKLLLRVETSVIVVVIIILLFTARSIKMSRDGEK